MKRILLSILTITLVVGIAVGATRAYYSDSATSTSNSFHSGTLNLKLKNDGGSSYSDSVTGTFDASDMVPGGPTVTGKVWLKNEGTVGANHVRITSVVNTPSDNGVNEPECKAYGGEWKSGFGKGWCCVLPNPPYNGGNCGNYGGMWGDTGDGLHCYAEDTEGFKDGLGTWNDIDKYLQVTSMTYAGTPILLNTGPNYDVNGNGYIDLDDLEKGYWTKDGYRLDNLTPPPGISGSDPHSFEMEVKLHGSADSKYQTDKNGIEVTFQLNQDVSQ